MVIVGDDGRIVLVNAQTEKLFGYARAELLGQDGRDAGAAALSRASIRSIAGDTSPTPRCARWASGLELYGLRKDGTEFPVEISLSPLETEDGRAGLQRDPRHHRPQAGRG